MKKVNKLKMFYNLENSQGIQLVLNIETSTSAPAPLETIASTLAIPHISVTDTSTFAPKVDQLMDVMVTLTAGESFAPLVSTKRGRDEDQRSHGMRVL